jgi:hypothetical protein
MVGHADRLLVRRGRRVERVADALGELCNGLIQRPGPLERDDPLQILRDDGRVGSGDRR